MSSVLSGLDPVVVGSKLTFLVVFQTKQQQKQRMASDRPESEEEERREGEEVIEEEDEEEVEDGIVSPELMIKHPLQVSNNHLTLSGRRSHHLI